MNKKQGFIIHIELTLKHVQDTVKSLDALRLKPKKYAPLPLPEYRSDENKSRLVRLYKQ